jgi:hypothetical protein
MAFMASAMASAPMPRRFRELEETEQTEGGVDEEDEARKAWWYGGGWGKCLSSLSPVVCTVRWSPT